MSDYDQSIIKFRAISKKVYGYSNRDFEHVLPYESGIMVLGLRSAAVAETSEFPSARCTDGGDLRTRRSAVGYQVGFLLPSSGISLTLLLSCYTLLAVNHAVSNGGCGFTFHFGSRFCQCDRVTFLHIGNRVHQRIILN